MLTLIAALAAMAQPDYSDYRQVVNGQVQHFRSVHQVQDQCEALLVRWGERSSYHRKYLERTAWDRPGGWVDPSAINAARYQFTDISAHLRDEIDRIQRSPNPQYIACQLAYARAARQHMTLLRSLLYNGH